MMALFFLFCARKGRPQLHRSARLPALLGFPFTPFPPRRLLLFRARYVVVPLLLLLLHRGPLHRSKK